MERGMKDYEESTYRDGRPSISSNEAVEFCLNRLFEDEEHSCTDEVVHGLTFEELIGALLLAEDMCFDPELEQRDDYE